MSGSLEPLHRKGKTGALTGSLSAKIDVLGDPSPTLVSAMFGCSPQQHTYIPNFVGPDPIAPPALFGLFVALENKHFALALLWLRSPSVFSLYSDIRLMLHTALRMV